MNNTPSETKKIVIINQDSGYLMIDLAQLYIGSAYDVTLVTGRLVQRNKLLPQKLKFQKIISYDRSSTFKRLFSWLVAMIQLLFLIWFKFRNLELLIVSNPPVASLLPLLVNNKFSLLIYDVYPDVLSNMGLISSKAAIVQFWRWANQKVYPKAERIITLTEGMKNILQKYTGMKEIEIIPVWTDNHFLKPIIKKDNPFVKTHGYTNKFLVVYSGNLGFTQEVEVIVKLATLTKDTFIQYIIIGNGEKKNMIQQLIEKHQLKNCVLLPFQKPEDLPYSLAAADLAVVTLSQNASQSSVPSKIYNLMSVGAPILCIASKDSELNKLVVRHQMGQCFQSCQLGEMLEFILDLKQFPEKQKGLSENSLKASLEYREENVKKFLKISEPN